GQLLKHLHRRHRREIEPAIGFGQKQAEKAGPREFLGKVFRYPPRRFETVAIGDDTRSKRPRGLRQRGADSSIRHRCLPPRPAAGDGYAEALNSAGLWYAAASAPDSWGAERFACSRTA